MIHNLDKELTSLRFKGLLGKDETKGQQSKEKWIEDQNHAQKRAQERTLKITQHEINAN